MKKEDFLIDLFSKKVGLKIIMHCDSCGEDFEEKDLKEYKIFGKKNYICKKCKAAMYE